MGAARIIGVDNPRDPYVVSNIRFEVNQLKARRGPQASNPGAPTALGGYAAKTQAAGNLERQALWFGDGSGLWVVRLSNAVWPRGW